MSSMRRGILSTVLLLTTFACAAAAQNTCSTRFLLNAYTQNHDRLQTVPVVMVKAKVGGKPTLVNAIRPSSQPLHWEIVIDGSGSMMSVGMELKTKLKWRMAIDLARKVVATAPKDSDIGLLMFWGEGRQAAPATMDKATLMEELERFRALGSENEKPGKTALWDSIARANTMLSPSSAHNVIVVISDGGDNSSHLQKSALTKELAQTGTRVFSLVLYEPFVTNEERAGAADLVELAEERGGIALTLNAQDLLIKKPLEQDQTLSAVAAVVNDFATNSYEVELNTNAGAKIEELVLKTDPKNLHLAYPRAILSCSGSE